MNLQKPDINTRSDGTCRLRQTAAASPSISAAIGAAAFTVMALAAYMLAYILSENMWYGMVFGVTIGALSFCAARVWINENDFSGADSKAYIVLSGVLSFIGIMLAYIYMGTFPFGDHTVLIIDMHHQYVAFFSLLRDTLLGGGSLVYTDSLGLGAGFLPMWAYYVASPFSIITLLFPKEMITEALLLITVLKITAAGVTFSIFARKKFGRNDFSIVIGAVAYSLMSFFIGHSWNLMWLDPIILLPLVVLGFERLMKEGRPALYCITLALALASNYYIGYMVCIFMVIYFFAYIIAEKDTTTRPALSEKFWKIYRVALAVIAVLCAVICVAAIVMEKYILILAAALVMAVAAAYFVSIRFWRFCYASIIGGGMSAAVILPAFISLMDTSGADDSFARALANNFSFFELFPRTLFSASPSMRGDSFPNIYCTVLALVLLVVYLTCKAIPLRQRLAWGGVVAVIGYSMSLNWLNFAWHGFHFPNDLPYRFSFLMSFAMLCVAVQMLDKLRETTPGGVALSAVIIAALILIEQQFGSEADFVMIFVSLIAVLLYSVIIGLHSAGKLRAAVCYAMLTVLVFGEAAANATVEMVKLDRNEYYTERYSFVEDFEVDRMAFDLIESYKEDDPGEMMYREELLPRKTCNDPSLFQYNGMTVFASSNRRSVTTLMGKLGYAVNGVNSYLYKNYVPVCDSILGLKYIALGHEIGGHPQLVGAGSVTDSQGYNSRYIYQNTAALSKAFVVSRSIINWNWEDMNPYIVQNSLLNNAVGAEDVYDLLFLQSDNAVYDEAAGGYVSADYGTTVSEFNCSVNINGTYFTCSRTNETISANFTATRVMPRDGQAYAYIDCRAATSISVAAGDTNVGVSPTEPYIVDLGYLTAGTEISTTIYTDMSCGGNIFLGVLNEDVFDSAIGALQQNMLDVTEYKEGRISGTINSSINGMMFTSIPYDSGWKVKVDGERVDTFALGDGLLCFAVPLGEHTVDMRFVQPGLVPGLACTLLCLAVFLLLVLQKPRRWITERIPESVFAADGVDHRLPEPRVYENQLDGEPHDDFAEGFEEVDLNSMVPDSVPADREAYRGGPVMPREQDGAEGFEGLFDEEEE